MARFARPAVAFVLMVIAIVVVILWSITETRPAWYRPPDPTDEHVSQIADSVENRVLEEVHKIRDESGTWTVRLRDAPLNAWLSAKLPKWLEREQQVAWPDEIGAPQIRFSESGVELAVEVLGEHRSRVIVLKTVPSAADGRLTIALEGVDLGRMTIPGSFIETLVRSLPTPEGDDRTVELWDRLLAGEGVELGELKLTDQRRVELVDLKLGEGTLEVTCRTVRP